MPARPLDRQVSPHSSRNLEKRLWVLRSDHEQCARRTRWCAATLFPLLKSANRYAEEGCKLDLRKAGSLADGRDRGNADNAAHFSSLQFAQTFEDLASDISTCHSLSHRSRP